MELVAEFEVGGSEWRVFRVVLGELETNTFVLTSNDTVMLVIDPADDLDLSPLQLPEHHLSVVFTHLHPDHVYRLSLDKVRYYAHKADIEMLSAFEALGKMFNLSVSYPSEILALEHWPRPDFVQVLHTPGHTPGSVSFFLRGSPPILVSGDLLFAGGIGRTDLPGGDLLALRASLNSLHGLPPETILLPGHGPISTLGKELKSLEENGYL